MKHSRKQIVEELSHGFSLIETLIFVTILGFIFIAAAALGTVSLRNSQNSANRILATRYGEELFDWLNSQKDSDWQAFVGKSSPKPGTTYCFSAEPVPTPTPLTWGSLGNCSNSNQLVNSLFTRQATLIYDPTTQRVNVKIDVSWKEGGNSFDVPINGVFALFE